MDEAQTTITFRDAMTGEEACVIVRPFSEGVGLCLSLASDGDIEATLPREVCEKLVRALGQASGSR